MWRMAGTAIAILLAVHVAFAQLTFEASEPVELTGNWVPGRMTQAFNNQRPYDFVGMPLSESGKAWALSHDEAQLSEPERQCAYYTPTYHPYGFSPLPIWKEPELRTGSTQAWIIGGWQDVVPMVIWMDGRPHPSKYAPHEKGGFTTGVWENDVLTTYTTHMHAGLLHRIAPHSDRATMTMRFIRHGDILSLVGRIDDPVYLTDPVYVSREFQLRSAPLNPTPWPCTITYEGILSGEVPHFLPGQHPFIEETTQRWGIPQIAVEGGAETMYPEFRKKLKDMYRRPATCPTNEVETSENRCGGVGVIQPVT